MIKIIRLTNGKETIIDSSDWIKVKDFNWGYGFGGSGYAGTNIGGRKNHKQLLLHRFIMDTPKGMVTDHINGNKLDNRRKNLRICTQAENSMNCRKNIIKSSKYKGVSWFKRDKCWRAYINLNRRQIHIGYFTKETDAVKAYNKQAIKVHKTFANLNSI